MAGKEGNKQELKITFEFSDQSDPSKSQKNELLWVDTPDVIGLVQAVAIMPGMELMMSRFQQLAATKAVSNNPNLEEFLSKL
jgi:hypothetical protein